MAHLAGAFASLILMWVGSPRLANASDTLTVAVRIDAKRLAGGSLESVLKAIVGSAPLRIINRDAGIVETDAQGYNLMEANAKLTSVRIVAGRAVEPELAAERRPVALVEWTIHLETNFPGGAPGAGVELAQDRQATHSAAITGQRRFEARQAPPLPLGPGRLLVRALDATGGEVARKVIDDPRIIRAESADARGHLTRRRDIIRPTADFNVQLPLDARIVSIEVSASDDGRVLRTLATIPAH